MPLAGFWFALGEAVFERCRAISQPAPESTHPGQHPQPEYGQNTSAQPERCYQCWKSWPWAVNEKPGLGWIQGASLPLPVACPGCRAWCLGCCPLLVTEEVCCSGHPDVLGLAQRQGTLVHTDVCPSPGVHVLLHWCLGCSSKWDPVFWGMSFECSLPGDPLCF